MDFIFIVWCVALAAYAITMRYQYDWAIGKYVEIRSRFPWLPYL